MPESCLSFGGARETAVNGVNRLQSIYISTTNAIILEGRRIHKLFNSRSQLKTGAHVVTMDRFAQVRYLSLVEPCILD